MAQFSSASTTIPLRGIKSKSWLLHPDDKNTNFTISTVQDLVTFHARMSSDLTHDRKIARLQVDVGNKHNTDDTFGFPGFASLRLPKGALPKLVYVSHSDNKTYYDWDQNEYLDTTWDGRHRMDEMYRKAYTIEDASLHLTSVQEPYFNVQSQMRTRMMPPWGNFDFWPRLQSVKVGHNQERFDAPLYFQELEFRLDQVNVRLLSPDDVHNMITDKLKNLKLTRYLEHLVDDVSSGDEILGGAFISLQQLADHKKYRNSEITKGVLGVASNGQYKLHTDFAATQQQQRYGIQVCKVALWVRTILMLETIITFVDRESREDAVAWATNEVRTNVVNWKPYDPTLPEAEFKELSAPPSVLDRALPNFRDFCFTGNNDYVRALITWAEWRYQAHSKAGVDVTPRHRWPPSVYGQWVYNEGVSHDAIAQWHYIMGFLANIGEIADFDIDVTNVHAPQVAGYDYTVSDDAREPDLPTEKVTYRSKQHGVKTLKLLREYNTQLVGLCKKYINLLVDKIKHTSIEPMTVRLVKPPMEGLILDMFTDIYPASMHTGQLGYILNADSLSYLIPIPYLENE